MPGTLIVAAILLILVVFVSLRRRAASLGLGNAQALRAVMEDADQEYTLIDVRTPSEYRDGHIPTAVNIPHDKIPGKMPRAAKDSLVVLYCHSGSRASVARAALTAQGYTRVANFGRVGKWEGPLVEGGKPGSL